MKFTLKDYQADAVDDVLAQSRARAAATVPRATARSSFSLTATTGAGKTVMAAAAIEALFFGSDEFDFDADPGAVVIWFSDDPNLNDQTRIRLMEASEKFTAHRPRDDRAAVRQAAARAGQGVLPQHPASSTKNSLLTRGHVETTRTSQPTR